MTEEIKFTYILYIIEADNIENTVFLGECDDPANLYLNALNYNKGETANKKTMILKWQLKAQGHLSDKERKDLDNMFMHPPENGCCWCVKEYTLYLKKIRKF